MSESEETPEIDPALVTPPRVDPEHLHAPDLGRRMLAAILFTDVVNFTGRIRQDEAHTLTLVHRDLEWITHLCERQRGYVCKNTGDGLLLFFHSVHDAIGCALAIQFGLEEMARTWPAVEVLAHRMGLHLGDVFVTDTDVLGDGVNVANRLMEQATANGICFSQTVLEAARDDLPARWRKRGRRELKGLPKPMPVYELTSSVALDADDQDVPDHPDDQVEDRSEAAIPAVLELPPVGPPPLPVRETPGYSNVDATFSAAATPFGVASSMLSGAAPITPDADDDVEDDACGVDGGVVDEAPLSMPLPSGEEIAVPKSPNSKFALRPRVNAVPSSAGGARMESGPKTVSFEQMSPTRLSSGASYAAVWTACLDTAAALSWKTLEQDFAGGSLVLGETTPTTLWKKLKGAGSLRLKFRSSGLATLVDIEPLTAPPVGAPYPMLPPFLELLRKGSIRVETMTLSLVEQARRAPPYVPKIKAG